MTGEGHEDAPAVTTPEETGQRPGAALSHPARAPRRLRLGGVRHEDDGPTPAHRVERPGPDGPYHDDDGREVK